MIRETVRLRELEQKILENQNRKSKSKTKTKEVTVCANEEMIKVKKPERLTYPILIIPNTIQNFISQKL